MKTHKKLKSAKAHPQSIQPAVVAQTLEAGQQALIPPPGQYEALLAASNDLYQACMAWLSSQTSGDRSRVKAALEKYARGSWMS